MEIPSFAAALSATMQPKAGIILFSVAIALLLPVLLHLFMYRQRDSKSLPTFLVLGISGAGKTSMVTYLEAGEASATRTSQTARTAKAILPTNFRAASTQYRAAADPTLQTQPRVLLIDTPGHGKLRFVAHDALRSPPPNLKGLLFVVDAADLPANSAAIRETAEYLHEVLLVLQKRFTTKAAKGGKPFPVLLAATKMDLFTALPTIMVQKALELEISEVRNSREKGLLDSGTRGEEPEREWLGEGGESVFAFEQMLDSGVEVSVLGGAVLSSEADASHWWRWIADQL